MISRSIPKRWISISKGSSLAQIHLTTKFLDSTHTLRGWSKWYEPSMGSMTKLRNRRIGVPIRNSPIWIQRFKIGWRTFLVISKLTFQGVGRHHGFPITLLEICMLITTSLSSCYIGRNWWVHNPSLPVGAGKNIWGSLMPPQRRCAGYRKVFSNPSVWLVYGACCAV